jgi:hypothetical protein
MKEKIHTFLIYTKPKARQISGILGEFELVTIHFLLAGGKYLIEESYDGPDPISWYTEILGQQDIIVTASKQQKYKGTNYIWMEVDPEKTPISEFTSWKEVDSNDLETLAWRQVWYPCKQNKECLGLAVKARETTFTPSNKDPLTLSTILDAILDSGPKA